MANNTNATYSPGTSAECRVHMFGERDGFRYITMPDGTNTKVPAAWVTPDASEYVITDCPDHGVKVCSDRASFVHYVAVVRNGCRPGSVDHMIAHVADGTDCWTCCTDMVIDPHGILS